MIHVRNRESKMKPLLRLGAFLLVCLSFALISQGKNETVVESSVEETTVTCCWIERPLHKVLKDLEKIPNTSIVIDPDVNKRVQDIPISLEVIDIDLKQILGELLPPIGLTYTAKTNSMLITNGLGTMLQKTSDYDFVRSWISQNQLALPDSRFIKTFDSEERNGWVYLAGRVYDLDASSQLNKFRVIHRWISLRHRITITKKTIRGEKTDQSSISTYIQVPVVERIFERAAPGRAAARRP